MPAASVCVECCLAQNFQGLLHLCLEPITHAFLLLDLASGWYSLSLPASSLACAKCSVHVAFGSILDAMKYISYMTADFGA